MYCKDYSVNSILKGISFLRLNQLNYGEFKVLKSTESSMTQSSSCLSSSPYITTFILHSISFIDRKYNINDLVRKSLRFLQDEMELPGVWRFYSRNNRKIIFKNGIFKRFDIGIVPDFDDTACVSHCLRSNKIYFPDNETLFYQNRTVENIFYTWLLDKKELIREHDYIPLHNNICCGVNANIVMYLGDNSETKKTIDYINNVVVHDKEYEECNYFPNVFVLYYLISRAYHQGISSLELSLDHIITKIKCYLSSVKPPFDIISIILVIASLLNFNRFNSEFNQWIDIIINSQSIDGSWPAASFFIDTSNHYGSKELTTAIALEVISRSIEFKRANTITLK